jgi:hypothetical protein
VESVFRSDNDLSLPEDVEVEVKDGHVSRPHLTLRCVH